MKLTITEKMLLVTYAMFPVCFLIAIITMYNNLILYSLGAVGLMICINGLSKDWNNKEEN